jgi:hypothetical protein
MKPEKPQAKEEISTNMLGLGIERGLGPCYLRHIEMISLALERQMLNGELDCSV